MRAKKSSQPVKAKRTPQIWAFVNGKGGAGKTTSVINLSIAGQRRGHYASVLDLDILKSAERWSELRAELTGEEEPVIVHGAPDKLKEMIDTVLDEGSDLVLIDTPGSLDRTMLLAAQVSDIVVIPTRTSVLDQNALRDTLEFLGLAEKLSKCVVLLNATAKGQANDIAKVRSVAKEFDVPVAGVGIEDLPAFGTTLAKGRGAVEARGKAAKNIEAAFDEIEIHRARIMRAAGSK